MIGVQEWLMRYSGVLVLQEGCVEIIELHRDRDIGD